MTYEPVSEVENKIAKEIYDIAFKIHRHLGPGLLENIYEKCFCYELETRNIVFRKQVLVPINYENLRV
ncbi:MAG: GxxExxY protein, partial [bacterium]